MTIIRRVGEFKELRGVLVSAKVDKAHSGRDVDARGVATAAMERDEARVERDEVHAKAREVRDTTKKGWEDLVTLLEEEHATILEERGGMEFKIVEATMVERERWEGRT